MHIYTHTYVLKGLRRFAKPILYGKPQCIVRSKMEVTQLQICHGRSFTPIFQPSTHGFPFVSEPICCYLRVMHYFLKPTHHTSKPQIIPFELKQIPKLQ
jgi:hypothetical protein